jgi:hypothetical protein
VREDSITPRFTKSKLCAHSYPVWRAGNTCTVYKLRAIAVFSGSERGRRQKEGGWSRTRSEQPALAHLTGHVMPSISLTASSIEEPQPSLRISTPKILAAAIAPYSLAPAMVTSKGRI